MLIKRRGLAADSRLRRPGKKYDNSLLQIIYDNDPVGFLESYTDNYAGGDLGQDRPG